MLTSWSQAAWRTWIWLPSPCMKGRYGYRMGAPMGKSELVDTMVNDALWDATGFNKHMGMTAENVCTNETYQKKYGYSPITREHAG